MVTHRGADLPMYVVMLCSGRLLDLIPFRALWFTIVVIVQDYRGRRSRWMRDLFFLFCFVLFGNFWSLTKERRFSREHEVKNHLTLFLCAAE